MDAPQKLLSAQQTEAFYHDLFVGEQIAAFERLLGGSLQARDRVVDIGGGCGFFAGALARATGVRTRVIDMDPQSVASCRAAGVDAEVGDALQPRPRGDESIATFNMVLHHLVGRSERETRRLQVQALRAWRPQVRHAFVNEYIYEGFISPGLSTRLIWNVTSSQALSAAAGALSRVAPSLRANTLGVGVRFRCARDWRALFAEAGYEVVEHLRGEEGPISLPRRLLFIRSTRRDSFVLRPRKA